MTKVLEDWLNHLQGLLFFLVLNVRFQTLHTLQYSVTNKAIISNFPANPILSINTVSCSLLISNNAFIKNPSYRFNFKGAQVHFSMCCHGWYWPTGQNPLISLKKEVKRRSARIWLERPMILQVKARHQLFKQSSSQSEPLNQVNRYIKINRNIHLINV